MDDLAKEYAGRATVARFIIMTSYWTMPSVSIRDKYSINAVPIVVLFNKGVEVKRWVVIVPEDSCRKELDKLVPPAGRLPVREVAAAPVLREDRGPPPAAHAPLPSSPPIASSSAFVPPPASSPPTASSGTFVPPPSAAGAFVPIMFVPARVASDAPAPGAIAPVRLGPAAPPPPEIASP
jgi:hypothetical protein